MIKPGHSMWSHQFKKLPHENGLRYVLTLDQKSATYADVLDAWQRDEAFRTQFNTWLADAPYEAFRWENPAVTTATLTRPFEFVLLDSPGLDRVPDSASFAKHFKGNPASALSFPNLGGDAVMIVPRPLADPSAYGHLAAFVRHAPPAQRDDLWQLVGTAMLNRVSTKPVWLSTAGFGVVWLHIRLDDRPKYYGHEPYKRDL